MKTIKSGSKKTTAAAVTTPAAKAPASSRATAPAPVAKAPVAPAAKPHREITGACIASRAYSLWEQQGRPHGRDLELWLQAEKHLASQSFAA